MKKKLLKNWGLKLSSLLLAFILWLLVVRIEDPTKPVTFNNIPVKLINTELLEQENKVYEVLDNTDTVRVKISAPRSIADQLRPDDIVAEADISKLTDINTVAIQYKVNYELDKIEGDHDVVRLSVEDKKSKWVKLQTNTVGEAAKGYMIAGVKPDQTMIEVVGPESVVDQISYAGADIGVLGAANSLSANVEVQLYDENGNTVESSAIKKNVDQVHIEVEVLAVKEVPIELNVSGEPAGGYMMTGVVESSPASVRVAGTSYALSNLHKISIPAERLDVTGAKENVVEIINLRECLPDNVRLATAGFSGRVEATVYIEPEFNKTLEIPGENIVITNKPAGVKTELDETEEIYTLEVSGLEAAISPLLQNAVTGEIDLAAWMAEEEIEELEAGTYLIPITFHLAEDIVQENIVYARIVVSDSQTET